MRWPCLCWLFLGLVAAGASSALAASPAETPGCVGVGVAECLASLRASMRVDENFLAASLARRQQLDVNGRPLGGGLVTVNAKLPDRVDEFIILLHLAPGERVRSVESNVLLNLLEARTEPVYDASAVFDILSRLLGRRCPGLERLALYRFFENLVKPRITRQQEDLSTGLDALHRILSHAAGVPLCGGVTLAYTSLLEWRGGKNPEAAARRKEFSSIELE